MCKVLREIVFGAAGGIIGFFLFVIIIPHYPGLRLNEPLSSIGAVIGLIFAAVSILITIYSSYVLIELREIVDEKIEAKIKALDLDGWKKAFKSEIEERLYGLSQGIMWYVSALARSADNPKE